MVLLFVFKIYPHFSPKLSNESFMSIKDGFNIVENQYVNGSEEKGTCDCQVVGRLL